MCVLMVEADLVLRIAMAAALRRTGYEVEDTSDGHSAIAAFDRCPERFSFLVTDMQLADACSGRDVVEHVHACRPDLPVILASGDWKALGASWHRDRSVAALLKPYQARELLRLVGGMIENVEE